MFLPYGVTTIADIHNDTAWSLTQRDALKSGKIKVFTGPIYDNAGKIQIASGTTWTTADIYTKTNFFVKGVDGKVSQ